MRIVRSKRAGAEGAGTRVVNVYTTLANNDQARRLAVALLDERLIACANVFPVWSLYNWKGALKDENEVALFLKTAADRVPDVMRRIAQLHPYETPCIEVIPLEGVHGAYEEWVLDEVGESSVPARGRDR